MHLRSFSGAAVGRSFLHSWVKGNGLMLKPQALKPSVRRTRVLESPSAGAGGSHERRHGLALERKKQAGTKQGGGLPMVCLSNSRHVGYRIISNNRYPKQSAHLQPVPLLGIACFSMNSSCYGWHVVCSLCDSRPREFGFQPGRSQRPAALGDLQGPPGLWRRSRFSCPKAPDVFGYESKLHHQELDRRF